MSQRYVFRPFPRYLLRKKLIQEIVDGERCDTKSYLEIGYGHGDLLVEMSKRFDKAFGYDTSPFAVKHFGRKLKDELRGVGDIEIVLSQGQLETRSYDCLVACEVLEHIADDTGALRYWQSLLGDEGLLIISVPAHQRRWCRNDEVSGHIRRYEKEDLRAKLSEANFTVEKLWSYGYPLIILLDYFLNQRAKRKMAENFGARKPEMVAKDELTQKSFMGGDRAFDGLFSNTVFLLPFYILQRFFLNLDLSSAYLVAARKTNPGR